MRALLLVALLVVLACSSHDGGSRTADGPAGGGSSGRGRPAQEAPRQQGPGEDRSAADGDTCQADTDCTLTFLSSVEPRKAEDCCVQVCERRVESKKRDEELQAIRTRICSTVRCQQYDCPASIDPIPVCRDGRCVAREPR